MEALVHQAERMFFQLLAFIVQAILLGGFAVALFPGFVAMIERANMRVERDNQSKPDDHTVDYEQEVALPRFAGVLGLCWEGLINALVVILYPFGYSESDPQSRHDLRSDQEPIILVHGYTMNRSCWMYIRWQLRRDGFRNVFTINLPLFASIEDQSVLLDHKVEEVRAFTGAAKVTLIAHSQGGVLSQYYALNQGQDKVSTIAVIGGAMGGSKLAAIGYGPNARQITYRRQWLVQLQQQAAELPKRIRFVCIGSRHDNIIVPYTSAFLDPISGADNVMIEYLGHNALLFSSHVYEQLAQRLRHEHT